MVSFASSLMFSFIDCITLAVVDGQVHFGWHWLSLELPLSGMLSWNLTSWFKMISWLWRYTFWLCLFLITFSHQINWGSACIIYKCVPLLFFSFEVELCCQSLFSIYILTILETNEWNCFYLSRKRKEG